eukprot:Skav220866  [mRNA]  locus=scaffold193:311755:314064:+ [translate_table: standard]
MGNSLWGGRSSTEIIRPSKKLHDGPAEMTVPKGEQMFGMMPLCFATYPAIAMRLPKCDIHRLKQSLSLALDLVPKAAGRYREDADVIELNGAGSWGWGRHGCPGAGLLLLQRKRLIPPDAW